MPRAENQCFPTKLKTKTVFIRQAETKMNSHFPQGPDSMPKQWSHLDTLKMPTKPIANQQWQLINCKPKSRYQPNDAMSCPFELYRMNPSIRPPCVWPVIQEDSPSSSGSRAAKTQAQKQCPAKGVTFWCAIACSVLKRPSFLYALISSPMPPNSSWSYSSLAHRMFHRAYRTWGFCRKRPGISKVNKVKETNQGNKWSLKNLKPNKHTIQASLFAPNAPVIQTPLATCPLGWSPHVGAELPVADTAVHCCRMGEDEESDWQLKQLAGSTVQLALCCSVLVSLEWSWDLKFNQIHMSCPFLPSKTCCRIWQIIAWQAIAQHQLTSSTYPKWKRIWWCSSVHNSAVPPNMSKCDIYQKQPPNMSKQPWITL